MHSAAQRTEHPAGPYAEPVDHARLLGHIYVAKAWAGIHVRANLDSARAVTVSGDSMSPTTTGGDSVMVDIGCRRFEADGIYIIMFNDAMLIERLSAYFVTRKIRVRSANDKHDPLLAADDELTIYGSVQPWLRLREH